jgi:Zn-dependent peptidase ImmA (M78 family)/DNA-binding XRE family transcriptional regulator
MLDKFNPKTLIIARESRGLTQQDLAEKISFPQSALSKIENGNQQIDDDFLKKVSEALNFPKSFFNEDLEIYPPNLHYRKKSDVPSKILSYAEAVMNIYKHNVQKFLISVNLPFTKLPFLDRVTNITPQDAARYLRQFWAIPKGAINNVTKILEDNGILIIPMNFGTEKIDGRSMITSNGQFIIFINKKMSGDRLRYSLCHELAHIILHINSLSVFEVDIEKEAMVFASEFLMPEKEIKPQLAGSKLTIQKLADLKRYWKVSMQAILYWATTLKTVTDNQARYLWSQFNSLRIRVKEPIEIPIEKPSLLKEIITMFTQTLGYSKDELLDLTKLNVQDFNEWYVNISMGTLSIVRA